MNLSIDIGNSLYKAAVFREGELLETSQGQENEILELAGSRPGIKYAIISTVRKDFGRFRQQLESSGIKVMVLDEKTALPLANKYQTPGTLGKDRLAAAVGANAMFPGNNLLVIDAGTAITIDFVSGQNEYMGGNISPGLWLRFRALNEFTDNLPRVEGGKPEERMGRDTESAIRNGVHWGILFEIDEYINRHKDRYPDLQVIVTGGDAPLFEKELKNSIFVDLNLNLKGLARILDYNVGI